MKKTVLIFIAGLLLIEVTAFAAGDLTVSGNLGVGTETPAAKLDVRGSAVFNEDGGANNFRVEGDTDDGLFNIDGTLGKISITGGSAGVFRNNLFNVTGTDIKRAATYSVTRTFDYDENDFGIALNVNATRSGGTHGLTGMSGVLAIIHPSTQAGVSGGQATSFTFQIGSATGSGTVDINSVKGFNYALNRRYNIPAALTYNVTDSYGAYFGVQDGGSSTGGVVNVTNHYGNYIAEAMNTGGAKRVNITNHRGIYIEPLANATNNTLLALGGAATGNWSLFNASPYNNYFAGNVGLGTTNPLSKLAVSGLPTAPPDASSASYIVCIDPSGNMWIDNDGTNDCN